MGNGRNDRYRAYNTTVEYLFRTTTLASDIHLIREHSELNMNATTAKNISKDRESAIISKFLKAQDRLVYQTADLSLSSLSGMASVGPRGKSAIDLEPDFQRRKRWSPEKQSALIESFLMNVPVPPIYLAEDAFGQYSVVDGKQRLTAIHAFMSNSLSLKGLDTFKEIDGLFFDDLPEDLQNALTIRPYVRVVTLLKQSDPNLKFEVFTRLNRGGEPMLAQELRKVAYRGPFSDMIFDLSSSEFLKDRLKITSETSSAYMHMDDAEYVLRYFALLESWQTFSGALREELDRCMVRNSKLSEPEAAALGEKFSTALEACRKIWGQRAFQRHTGSGWRDQFLAGMYDAEMIAVSQLTPQELAKAEAASATVIDSTAALFALPEFEKAVRQGTNTPSFVRKRINILLDLLRGL